MINRGDVRECMRGDIPLGRWRGDVDCIVTGRGGHVSAACAGLEICGLIIRVVSQRADCIIECQR